MHRLGGVGQVQAVAVAESVRACLQVVLMVLLSSADLRAATVGASSDMVVDASGKGTAVVTPEQNWMAPLMLVAQPRREEQCVIGGAWC